METTEMHRRVSPAGVAAAVAAGLLAAAGPATAWHGRGHQAATHLAVEAAGGQLPAFFAAGAATAAHCSLDPDTFTRPIAPEPLHSAEAPEHFFDIELLKDANVPPSRPEFIALCARMGLRPEKVGLLPYAVTEWTQRLTVALAEHRADPNNPHVRAKCLVYAGLLAHYAQDLCQPLHVTIHWDGRARADGSSPRSGIHARLDALPQKLRLPRAVLLRGLAPGPLPAGPLLPAVLAELHRSHALVDRVYELEKNLPAVDAELDANSPAGAFAAERLRAAAAFTASLYLTACRDSAAAKLPAWHKRDDGGPVPSERKR